MFKLSSFVYIYPDRPALKPEFTAKAKGLFADLGASGKAMPDLIFGNYKADGRSPIKLPISMEVVRNPKEDVPYDSPCTGMVCARDGKVY